MVNIGSIKAFIAAIKRTPSYLATNPVVKDIQTKGIRYCPQALGDVYVRTIPQKKSVQLIDNMAGKLNITPDNYETLSLQLYRNIHKSGKNFASTGVIKELVQKTGLSEAQFAQEMDSLATMITLLKPTSLKFEEPHKIFDIMIWEIKAKVSYIAKGMSGSVYKIEIPGAKPIALKKYHGDIHQIANSEGVYAEAAIQKKLYEDGGSDTAALICTNPDRGWILSEFIDSNYKMRTNGIKVKEYLEKNGLMFDDINGGMNIKDSAGNDILVEFGYIIPKSRKIKDLHYFIIDVNEEILKEKQTINYDKIVKLYEENPKKRFQIIHDLQRFYDEGFDTDLYKTFYERTKNTPQMRLNNDYSWYLFAKEITDDSIMPASERLQKAKAAQKAFNECGFEVI